MRENRELRIKTESVLLPYDNTSILVVKEMWWHLDIQSRPIFVTENGWIPDEGGEPILSPDGTGYKYGEVISLPGGRIEEDEKPLPEDSIESTIVEQLRERISPRRYCRQIAAAQREINEETGVNVAITHYLGSVRFPIPELCRRLLCSFWVGKRNGGTIKPGHDIMDVLSLPPSEFWFPEMTAEIPWKFPFMPEMGQMALASPHCPVGLPMSLSNLVNIHS